MKLRKRIFAGLLCAMLAVSSLAACSNNSADSGSSESKSSAQSSEKSEADSSEEDSSAADSSTSDAESVESVDTGELTEIIWQWPSVGSIGAGFQDVEDALNEKFADVGAKVRLEPVGLLESQNEAVLMVSAGEQLDICLTAFTGLGPVVDSGLIHPLDDLIDEYGSAITRECGAGLLKSSYKGSIYAVPTAFMNGGAHGYAIRQDMADKYGIVPDPDKIYTMDEISEIFETVKAGEGDNFYCTIPWNKEPEPLNNSYIAYDRLAGSLAGGVLMLNRSFEDLTIYNLFATEEYADYTKMVYDWAQKGYISPDAAVTTEEQGSLLRSGNYLGEFYWADPGAMDDLGNTTFQYYGLTTIPGLVDNNGGNAIHWSIPITSVNPEKAMQVINYIYEDKEAAWLLQFGIEGESYEILEETEDGMLINYLSDETETLPYFTPYGIYGNRLEWPAMYPAPIDKYKIMREWDEAIPESRYSPALGYTFIQEDVSTEIAAVTTVMDQYTPSFNCGAVDPETMLPEFLSALEAAGIDKVIEENQRQLDEWAASQK